MVIFGKGNCFTHLCLKKSLACFNFLFLVFGLIIATLPVYFEVSKMLKSWPINGGIIGMGALLIFVAIFGCYGSIKQHQIILFFYMVVLGLVCLITFAFALAALSLSKSQQEVVLGHGWKSLSQGAKANIQKQGNCCGFNNSTSYEHPTCKELHCFDQCSPCFEILADDWFIVFRRATGGVALFVSLMMCISIYFTYHYRHIKNPRADPNEYL